MLTRPDPGPPKSNMAIVASILAMIVAPAWLTLICVRGSSFDDTVGSNPTPYGYSVSLSLFLVPIITISAWLLPRQSVRLSKQALLRSVAFLFPWGAALDFFFAHLFLKFPNLNATLSIPAPALGLVEEGATHNQDFIFLRGPSHILVGSVPVEEYIFYLSGFSAVLLQYIWLDEYWFATYSVPDDAQNRTNFERLLLFHPLSFIAAVVLVFFAILYRWSFYGNGFPGYLVFLVVAALGPSSFLFHAALPVINWRAFSLTLLLTVLTSLLWEATLALPYGWWGYQSSQMVGLSIRAWHNLPIEAVCVWIAVTYVAIMTYEVVKRWKSSGKKVRKAFFGTG